MNVVRDEAGVQGQPWPGQEGRLCPKCMGSTEPLEEEEG